MGLVGKSLLSFFLCSALLSLVAVPVVATTVQYVPTLAEIRNKASGSFGPIQTISFNPSQSAEQTWTSFELGYTECQLLDNGSILRTARAIGGTGSSVTFETFTGLNNTWLENVRLTTYYDNQGSSYPIWTIYIQTMRNEQYLYEFTRQPKAWGYNASYHYFEPYPENVADENIYFYRDAARLDSIMENALNTNLTNRATFYAYATGLDLRTLDIHTRLIETAYTNGTAISYALECVDWIEYALSQSYVVQTLARYNASNVTVLKTQSERLWMDYEIAAYLQLAAKWAQQGWVEGTTWAFDYAFSLYEANYESYQRPLTLPAAPPETGQYDFVMLGGAVIGAGLVLVGIATRNPYILIAAVATLAIAGAVYGGYL